MRLRTQYLFTKPASKLASALSGKHEVLKARCLNVRVRYKRSGKKLWVHHDCVSNPFIFCVFADTNVPPPTLREDSADELSPPDAII